MGSEVHVLTRRSARVWLEARAEPWSLSLSLSEEQSPVCPAFFFFLPEFKAEHQRHVSVTQAEIHRTRATECSIPLPRQGRQFAGEHSHLLCLHRVLSTHFLQRMKTNRSTPETSVQHLLSPPRPRGQEALTATLSRHRWPAICRLPSAITL